MRFDEKRLGQALIGLDIKLQVGIDIAQPTLIRNDAIDIDLSPVGSQDKATNPPFLQVDDGGGFRDRDGVAHRPIDPRRGGRHGGIRISGRISSGTIGSRRGW